MYSPFFRMGVVMIVIYKIQFKLKQMQSDINYPKSKAFNIFLRFFQLALSLGCTIFVTELVEKKCITTQFRIVQIMIGVLLLVSFIALITIKCSAAHPKLAFAVFFILELAAVVGIAVFSFKDWIDGGESCAVTSIIYKYYLGTTAFYTAIVIAILVLPLLWVQRFTNSPGNMVWPIFFLFLAVEWPTSYRWTLVGVALGTLTISVITFVVNVVAGCKGITTTMKSFIKCFWILDLLLMVASQAIIVCIHIFCQNDNQYTDFTGNQAKVLFQIFILINLIDLIFWLYGLQTIEYENGDSIRDEHIAFGKNPQFDDLSEVNEYDPTKDAQYGQLR